MSEHLWECDICGQSFDDYEDFEDCMVWHKKNGDIERERERECLEERLEDLDRW